MYVVCLKSMTFRFLPLHSVLFGWTKVFILDCSDKHSRITLEVYKSYPSCIDQKLIWDKHGAITVICWSWEIRCFPISFLAWGEWSYLFSPLYLKGASCNSVSLLYKISCLEDISSSLLEIHNFMLLNTFKNLMGASIKAIEFLTKVV